MRTDLAERAALSALLLDLGPDAPTLCGDWTTRDLAAHLVIRERRPDAGPGVLVPALAGWTERVQRQYAARPWPQLVDLVRSGPPWFSPFALPVLGELGNVAEYYVHHEDVRRAQPDWQPRPPDAVRDAALWLSLRRSVRLTMRRAPCGVQLHAPGFGNVLAHKGNPAVTITGDVGELVLFAFGREQYQAAFDGPSDLVAAVRSSDRSL